ncbi:hypothetical protein H4582DRAFT_625799 [Lactarius indigo]|nr:hypothetical protein H4582DRAFT_625799 [Lactarius indigo]
MDRDFGHGARTVALAYPVPLALRSFSIPPLIKLCLACREHFPATTMRRSHVLQGPVRSIAQQSRDSTPHCSGKGTRGTYMTWPFPPGSSFHQPIISTIHLCGYRLLSSRSPNSEPNSIYWPGPGIPLGLHTARRAQIGVQITWVRMRGQGVLSIWCRAPIPHLLP